MVAMERSALCMAGVLKQYEKLIAKGAESGVPFWDIVVLTTTDAIQQEVYEMEIRNRLADGKLPSCAKYYVVHDPPEHKIGSGGSTMYTLAYLAKKVENFRDCKIMLMHAGGSSQRLPSASVLGKAFTAIPLGDKVYAMFDVKLAMCLPFVKKLPKGVFISCSDTFETFTFGNREDFKIGSQPGFVALAHPSPMCLGVDHGVFVLPRLNSNYDTEVLSCEKVLQKPSETLMRNEGAVISPQSVPQNIRHGSPTKEEWVFTDSNFFFDHNISDKLIAFFNENKPLCDELCAYADFLQPLGERAADVYIKNIKNITTVSDSLLDTRKKVFDLLRGSQLKIITLKQSKFYHFGTFTEYLESFCDRGDLKEELGLSSFCYSAVIGGSPAYMDGCVIHSLISDQCHFDHHSVVEFCHFTGPVTVQANSVISNCTYVKPQPLTIPPKTFMQTVPVMVDDGGTKYVTLCFSTRDDMKAKAECLQKAACISYFERSIFDMCMVLGVSPDIMFSSSNSPVSLWHAKLFPLSDTPEQSFLNAIQTIEKLINSPVKRAADAVGQNEDKYLAIQSEDGSIQRYPCPPPDSEDTSASNGSNPPSPSASPPPNVQCYANCSHNSAGPMLAGRYSKVLYSFADVVRHKNAQCLMTRRNKLAQGIDATMKCTEDQ